MATQQESDTLSAEKRRHSTRFVKRKKFDDELVESSLNKQERARTSSKSQSDFLAEFKYFEQSIPSTSGTHTRTTRASAAALSQSQGRNAEVPTGQEKDKTATEKRKAPAKASAKSKAKKPRTAHSAQLNLTKDLGRWKPQDDLMLIEAVQQTSDLKQVHLGCKFSCNFTLREIESRWYALLYDEKISKLAMTAIKQLPFDEVIRIQSNALFSTQEEAILSTVTVPSRLYLLSQVRCRLIASESYLVHSGHLQFLAHWASQATLETFRSLLSRNYATFHTARTPKSLHQHWLMMKQFHLLPDQTVQPLPNGDHVLNFSDAEELMDDTTLAEPADESVNRELLLNDKKQKKEIRMLEQELPKYQALVESITGVNQPDFDNQTLAILRGRLVRYLMRSKEISIGRSAKDNQVDVDLALEGPAFKISRRQGLIRLKNSGDFHLLNQGKRPFYVDGKPILQHSKAKLHNNSVIEISCLRFIFLINQELIRSIKNDSTQKPSQLSQ